MSDKTRTWEEQFLLWAVPEYWVPESSKRLWAARSIDRCVFVLSVLGRKLRTYARVAF